jgi:hypothetical protein
MELPGFFRCFSPKPSSSVRKNTFSWSREAALATSFDLTFTEAGWLTREAKKKERAEEGAA